MDLLKCQKAANIDRRERTPHRVASSPELSHLSTAPPRPAPTGSRSRSGCGRAGFPARTRPQGRRTVGPRRVPPADVEQDQRDRPDGCLVSGRGTGGWRSARARCPFLASLRRRCGPPRDRRRPAPASSASRRSPARPPGGSPTPGPGCRTPRGYGVEQARGSGDAALPVEAGERNRPVPTRVHTGTLVRASASTVQHPEFPGSSGRQRVPGAGN